MNKKLLLIIFIIGALCCSYAATPLVPQKPQPDIRDGDRLYASWLNGMFGTIYNWAQNQQIETDKLLHNGAGVASLTANLIKALGEIETPLIHVDGRDSVPATPKTDDGYIYFDKNTKRFMGYQEGQWRDLSPVTIVNGSDLSSPLIVGGYLKADNIYADSIKIGSTDKAHNEISSQTATINIGSTGALKLPSATDLTKLNTTLGTGSIAYNPTTKKLYVYDGTNWVSPTVDITVDSEISSTSTNPVQNKKVVEYVGANLQTAKSYADTQDATTLASAKSYTDTKTSGLSATVDTSMSSTSTNAVQNKVIKKYVDDNKVTVDSAMSPDSTNPVQNKIVRSYIDTHDSQTLSSAVAYTDGKISELDSNFVPHYEGFVADITYELVTGGNTVLRRYIFSTTVLRIWYITNHFGVMEVTDILPYSETINEEPDYKRLYMSYINLPASIKNTFNVIGYTTNITSEAGTYNNQYMSYLFLTPRNERNPQTDEKCLGFVYSQGSDGYSVVDATKLEGRNVPVFFTY